MKKENHLKWIGVVALSFYSTLAMADLDVGKAIVIRPRPMDSTLLNHVSNCPRELVQAIRMGGYFGEAGSVTDERGDMTIRIPIRAPGEPVDAVFARTLGALMINIVQPIAPARDGSGAMYSCQLLLPTAPHVDPSIADTQPSGRATTPTHPTTPFIDPRVRSGSSLQ